MLPDNERFDTIIVGAGLAGVCAALHLSQTRQVLVLEAEQPAAGASGAAAGLVNPLMSQKAKAAWRMNAALHALHATLSIAHAEDLLSRNGILRPATDARQADIFHEVASARPANATWLPPETVQERFADVVAPHGALLVRRGGAIAVPTFIEAMLTAAQQQGARLATGAKVVDWGTNHDGVYVNVHSDTTTTRLHTRQLILALGYGYDDHPALCTLNLHPIKGQTVEVKAPTNTLSIPLAGQGYIVPEGNSLIVGSSYERGFSDLRPSAKQTRLILEQAATMLPALRNAPVLDATAGVRVTVPGTRLPMVGPLPGQDRIWIFTGLGSKGLLMAPLLAQQLTGYLDKPDSIPQEIRVRLAK
ncbi:MAG TPA: FAD-dependent oxidoreductase [Rhodothermales bacterium]|nr:FAD-dependent oxidoreductase [Rhodothermales bacterium]